MSILSFMGWPDCAKAGCGNPGLVKVELDGPAGPLWAHLCITCMTEMQACLGTLEEAQRAAETGITHPEELPPAGLLEHAP